MSIFINLFLLLILFAGLGWMANLAVNNIKYIGAVLKIRLFAFGILLGLFTTLPELSVGINATVENAAAISVGNVLGGAIVMLGLILGVSLLLNREIATSGRLATLIPSILVIFSPVFLGLNGKYSLLDGLVMICLYVGLVFYLYRLNQFGESIQSDKSEGNLVFKAIIFSVFGIIGVLVASHWIVEVTQNLLDYVNISQFVVGLAVFSIGTNLPEISIALTSWRKKSSELSLSHLVSSAFTNVLILGILAFIRPINFSADVTYWITAIILGILLTLFAFFYYSDKKLDRREGIILLIIYALFVAATLIF